MNDDTELLEQEEQDVQDQVQLPEHPAGKSQSRQELIDSTLESATAEAGQESVIEELASQEAEPTVDDLRRLPGAEGLTDEQIEAEWAKAVAAAEGTGLEADGETFKLPFPVYDAQGNKIEALEKISVKDLFEGKIHLGYNANGKEQRKTLQEALRNASMGHWNEQKYNTTLEERNRVAQDLATAREQLARFQTASQTWDAALTALIMGNTEPMKQLAREVQARSTQFPAGQIPGYVPEAQVREEEANAKVGWEFIQNTIVPTAMDIAKRYDADPKEVLGAIDFYLQREPAQFMNREKIESILNYEVPMLFESKGYTASSPAVQNDEVAELKRTVAALQASVAEKKNAQTENIRTRQRKAPPAGGGSTPGAGDSMPSFKSRAQFKAWSRGEEDWASA